MAQPDDLCVCGHALREHCFCGCMCLHTGEPIYLPKDKEGRLRELALHGRTYECRAFAERLLRTPVGYVIDCDCTGFKEKK